MVDISKIRAGDRITVVMTVREVESDSLYVIGESRVCRGEIHAEDIATHEPAPRPIAIGDRVRVPPSIDIATVKAIDDKDQQAWLQWQDGHYGTLPLSALELCEEGA